MATNAEIVKRVEQLIIQLNQLHILVTESTTEESKEAIKLAEKGICTYCREPIGDEKPHRGAHPRCYKRVNRAINSGETSDSQAVSRGWVLEADKGGNKISSNDPIKQANTTNTKKKVTKRKKR